jgi:hypothetical protein
MSKHHAIVAMLLGALGVLATAPGAHAGSMSDSMDPTPPPPAPASVCTAGRTLGGAASCKPRALWYEYAHQDCAARGYPTIGAVAYVDACWKGFRAIEYTCCN